jgi:Domain of unknown function (DUF4177)
MEQNGECKIVHLLETISQSEELLNKYASKGWELVTTFSHPNPEHFAPYNPPEPKSSNSNFVIIKRKP